MSKLCLESLNLKLVTFALITIITELFIKVLGFHYQ